MELDKRGMILIVFFIFFIFGSLKIYAGLLDSDSADNSEWLMFGRYLNGTRSYYDPDFKPVYHLLWTYDITGVGMTGPATISNGILYAGLFDSRNIVAINATTGVKIWSYVTGDIIEGAPAIANNTVFIGSADRAFYALDALTGNYLWNFTNTSSVRSSAAVSNGIVYFSNTNTPCKLFALNITNGNLIWNNTVFVGQYATPLIINDIRGSTIYIGNMSFNATDGNFTWSTNMSGADVNGNLAFSNGTIYATTTSAKTIYAFNATNGDPIWNYTTGNTIYSSPAVANGMVYFGGYDKKVYALNASNGIHIWNYTTGDAVYASPLVVNDIVYIGSGIALVDKKFYALNATNGTKIWSYNLGYYIYSPASIANNIVYVAGFDGKIFAFNYPNNNYICSDADECDYTTISGALNGENNTGNIVYFLENDTNYYIEQSTSYTNVSMQFVNNANLVIDCNASSLNSTGSHYIFNFTNAINITIANCSFYNNPIYFDNLSYNNTFYHNNFYRDGVSGQRNNITGCFGGLGNFYDYRISNNSMLNGECGLINITMPSSVTDITEISINWTQQSSYNTTLNYTIESINYLGTRTILYSGLFGGNFNWTTSFGTYTINIFANDGYTNGTNRNQSITLSSSPPGGCSGCGEEPPPEPPPKEEEEVVPIEIPEDVVPDPIEDIDVVVEPDKIIVDFITESGIETKLKLILDDVGLLKKKPRLKIEFKMPGMDGIPKEFKMFNIWEVLSYIMLLIFIFFIASLYSYTKSGYKYINSGKQKGL